MAGDTRCAEHSGVSQTVLTMTERLTKMETRLERVDDRTAEIPALSAAVSQLVESQERLSRVFWGDGDRSVMERIRALETEVLNIRENGSVPLRSLQAQVQRLNDNVERIIRYFGMVVNWFWKLTIPIVAGLSLWGIAAWFDLLKLLRP